MKKWISVFLIFLFMVLSLCSCGGSGESEPFQEDGRLKIVTTIFPYYDFARQITGGKADVQMLLSPGTEPHDYEPTPSDIIKISHADLFFYTGGESDAWVESILESTGSGVIAVRLMDAVDLLHEEETAGHSHEEGEAHEHGDEYDEHIWTSPANAMKISGEILSRVSSLDSSNSAYYEQRGQRYLQQLKQLDAKFREITEQGKRREVVFGDRFPFLYLVKEYGLDYACAFPGCSSETEPSVATVTRLIDFVRSEKIPVVFYLDFSNQAVANLLCEDADAQPRLFHSCHSVTAEEFEKGVTYISLMEQNAGVLKEALN